MELWQMDIVGELLANGAERKVVTGIDDHSHFVGIAKVVRRATARLGVVDAILPRRGNRVPIRCC